MRQKKVLTLVAGEKNMATWATANMAIIVLIVMLQTDWRRYLRNRCGIMDFLYTNSARNQGYGNQKIMHI